MFSGIRDVLEQAQFASIHLSDAPTDLSMTSSSPQSQPIVSTGEGSGGKSGAGTKDSIALSEADGKVGNASILSVAN